MASNGRSLTLIPTQWLVISTTMLDVGQTLAIRGNQMVLKGMIEYMEVCSDKIDPHVMLSAVGAEVIVYRETQEAG